MNNELQAAIRARTRVAATLTIAIVVIYFAFVLLVSAFREQASLLIMPGLTIALLLAASLIVFAWVLTLVYVLWTNRHYDAVIERFRR